MKTKVLDENNLLEGAQIIRRGGLVVFPTETVYGLGADALRADAALRIYEAKGRPSDNPLIVHINNIDSLSLCAEDDNEAARLLLETFSPGPLTVIIKKSQRIPDTVTAGFDTVGIRIPSHPLARKFLELCAVPVAAPSANISGRPSPTNFAMAWYNMQGIADAVIDGGASKHGLESTIINCADPHEISILRPGSITCEMIETVLPPSIKLLSGSPEKNRVVAPGMKYTHYKPEAEILLYRRDKFSGIISYIENHHDKNVMILTLHPPEREECAGAAVREFKSLEEYGSSLFASFHEADEMKYDLIIAEYPDEEHLGQALRNRLIKASGGIFIK